MTRILLVGLVLFVAGLAGTGSMLAFQAQGGQNGSQPTNPDAEPPPALLAAANLPPETQFSDWGNEQAGLRCRVDAALAIEQGLPLKVDVYFKADPGKLGANVKKLNTFFPAAYLKLTLVHKQSGKSFQVSPYDPTLGMRVEDTGDATAPLTGALIKPLKVSFPLVKIGAELQPGVYECRVNFTFPPKPKWWHGTQAELAAAGFWHGTVESGPVPLTILKETPKTQIAWLPKQLRLTKGLTVTYGKEDAEQVTLAVRNGFVVGTKITGDGQSYSLQGGFPTPAGANPIDEWHDYKGGVKKATYTIEVFETADPPEHLWHPGPGSGGYKVLWKKSFTLAHTEEEIKKIKAGLVDDPAAPKKNAGKDMAASKAVRVNQVDFQAVVEHHCSAPAQGGKQALDLGLCITNQSGKALWFNLFDTLEPGLKSADGKVFAYDLFRLRTAPAKPILVAPGQTRTVLRTAQLEWRKVDKTLSLHLSGPDGSGGTWHFAGLTPGKYRLFFKFENTDKATAEILNLFKDFQLGAGESFWLGKITTEEVDFEILLENPKQDAGMVLVEKLIADLSSSDGQVRVAATKELFQRGKEVLPALKQAGAKQIAPFGGTIDGARRLDLVYSLIEGLPPNLPKPAGGYLTDRFGLHVAKDTTKEEIVAMGKKHGFSLDTDFKLDTKPNCYAKIAPGKSLGQVMQAVLTHEPKVMTLNLNYYEGGKAPKAAPPVLSYKDEKTGLKFLVEDDRKHITATDKDGKVFWRKDLVDAAKLKNIKPGFQPTITYLGKTQDWMYKALQAQKKTGDFVQIGFGKYFGVFNQRTGEFTFMGND